MAISARLKWYLDSHHVRYDLVAHDHSSSSCESARAAGVPDRRVAKCVLLEDERGYVLAVLAASRRIALGALEEQLHRKLELASETELAQLLPDCERGAVPPFGAAYNIPTVIDSSLLNAPEVYFEGGDHQDLVHMRGGEFLSLMTGARHAHFGRPA